MSKENTHNAVKRRILRELGLPIPPELAPPPRGRPRKPRPYIASMAAAMYDGEQGTLILPMLRGLTEAHAQAMRLNKRGEAPALEMVTLAQLGPDTSEPVSVRSVVDSGRTHVG